MGRGKKKPLPGHVCFPVKHAQTDAIKLQMVLIFFCPEFWVDAEE